MKKFLVLFVIPSCLIACSKFESADNSSAPPAESKPLISKEEHPALFEFLYQNSCNDEMKATYWFGYADIEHDNPGDAGFRVVLSVLPKGESIPIAYRVSRDQQGFSNGMTIKNEISAREKYQVANATIGLNFEGFQVVERDQDIHLIVPKDIGTLKQGDSIKLKKDVRTDSEIIDFIDSMGLYSNQFPVGCDQ